MKSALLKYLFCRKPSSPSLLTRDESIAMKGVYILLIVIGHNWFFTTSLVRWEVMTYFYLFHIAGFFIFPFLYGGGRWSWRRVGENAVRLLWPYLFLVTIFYVINWIVVQHNDFDASVYGKLVFIGSSSMLYQYCGFQVLWFLPAMFMAIILHDLYFGTNRIVAWCVGLLCLLVAVSDLLYFFNIRLIDIRLWSYYGIKTGVLMYCLYGIVARWLIDRYGNSTKLMILCGLVAIIITIFYFYFQSGWIVWVRMFNISSQFYPIAFMILVWGSRRWWMRWRLVTWFGRNSLLVYLVHPFVGFAAIYALKQTFLASDGLVRVAIVIGMLIAITSVTGAIVLLINRMGRVKRFLFPHNFKEWISVWK